MAWTGIWKHQVEGIAFSGAKVGDYYIAPSTYEGTPCPTPHTMFRRVSQGGEETTESYKVAVYSRCPGVSFRYQNTDKTYIEIIMFGLIYINPVGYFGSGVDPRGILHNYSLSCQNIGARSDVVTTNNIVYYVEEIQEIEDDTSSRSHSHQEIVEVPVFGALYDPLQGKSSQLLGLLAQCAGSVYVGIQNIYHNLVCNVQLGHKFEIKMQSADDESGFIIPFDLINMRQMGIFKLNDLMRSGLYVVSEYFKWDRKHYKKWKKWVGYILGAIIIVVAIIVAIYCPPAGASIGSVGSALIGGGVLATIVIAICKLVIALAIAIVVKVISKAVFGDSFIGKVFQVIATVVAMYYCGCIDGNALSITGSTVSTALNVYIDSEKEKIDKLKAEQLQIEYKGIQAKTKYTSQMDLISKKMLAMSNPNSNFNVNVFINGLLLNSSKPCIDGIVPISTWNDTLTNWSSSFYNAFINDPLNMDQYLQLQLS